MIRFELAQMVVREVEAEDLEPLLAVYTSNPAFVARMEGSEGEAGKYDLARCQRDWIVARMMPERHLLGGWLRDSGAAVGLVDFVEEHERYGRPWLGALVVHHDYQRRGLGSKLCRSVLAHLHTAYGATAVNTGVAASNMAGLAFFRANDFSPIDELTHRGPAGEERIIVMEWVPGPP
jgi:ribosomal protein S18 acetylase RimI-like enzyme